MDHPADLIDYLHANGNSFQNSDSVIARFILKYGKKVVKMTVTELAEKLDLSDATIIRFCQKIGFKGYYQMKIVLAQSLGEYRDGGSTGGNVKDPISFVSDIVLDNIGETRKKLDGALIDRAAKLIGRAENVFFFAVGNSYPIAFDAAYKLSRIGVRTFVSNSVEYQISNAWFLNKKSIAFGISHSGASKTVLKTFEIAKSRGAPVILLSNYEKSPLSRIADINLTTRAYREYFLDAGLVTRICEMYLMDVLFLTVLIRKNSDYSRLFQEKEESMSEFTV
ncbi:MAG: MurR/RpiR family transcriptional regulator [Treponema sp.]|jgi:DNA-binding MurR/RpiR family transcriptional regulator|nr:MurR/RpiR family transcriptional regulator [Treponema sp.]